MNKIQIINKSICYPKSETIIVPGNLAGIMTKGVLGQITKEGFRGIEKEAKKILEDKNIKIEDCISTYPGRLNKRGIKKIYYALIKRFPNDITTMDILKKSLIKSLEKVIKDGFKSVSVCGIGIEQGDLNKKIVAKAIIDICKKYENDIEIKIVDEDVDFINEVSEILEGKSNGNVK